MKAFLGLLLALLVGLNIWQYLDRAFLRQEIEMAVRQTEIQFREAMEPLQEEAAVLRKQKHALTERLASLESPSTDSPKIGENPMKAFSEAMENPGMKEMMAAQQRATLDAVYRRLYERLALEGEELAHFQTLITDAQMTMMEQGMKMLGGDLSESERKDLAATIADAQKTLKERVKAFLNDDADFDYYNFYTESIGERTAMNGLRSVLEPAGNALAPETEEALVQLMVDERQAIGFEEHYYDQNRFDPGTMTQAKMDRFMEQYDQLQSNLDGRAATLLTGTQLEAFRANQKTSRAMQEMGLGMLFKMFGQQSP